MSPLGFKARVGSALFAVCGGECNVHSPRSTSGATLADLSVIRVPLYSSGLFTPCVSTSTTQLCAQPFGNNELCSMMR